MNKWLGTGNLGKDVDIRYTQTGDAVANFSIACEKVWFTKDREKKKRTDWIPIVVWGKRAETIAQHLGKGSKVLVVGEIQIRSYEDKNGLKRYITEVLASEIEFLSPSKQRGEPDASAGAPEGTLPPIDDEIPF